MKEYKLLARRLFFDWHMPDFLPEVYLDVEYFVDKLVEVGAESIDFMCKTAFGNCLYPSKVGFPNKAIKGDGDIYGKVCKLAKSRGLEVFAYYNMVLNDIVAPEHPEWRQCDLNGEPLFFEHHKMLCMNSPYREHAFAQVQEIATMFEVDGIDLDLQYFHPAGCFCRWCKEGFRERFGYDLDPTSFSEMQNWIDLHDFQRDSRKDFIGTAKEKAEEIRPNLRWFWNNSGYFRDDVELDAKATMIASEAHPPEYLESIARAKWVQSSGKPPIFWMPESIGSWGHWSITNFSTLKGMCAVALAHGGAISFNHVAPPCGDYRGRVFPAVYALLSQAMQWIKEREHLCIGKKTVPVTAILHSARNTALEDAFLFAKQNGKPYADDKALGIPNSYHATLLLSDSRIPTDFLYNEESLDRLDEYEAVVLPNIGYMDDAFADRIREYVASGGKLLATYNTSLLDSTAAERDNFLLDDLFGVDFEEYSDFSVIYIDRFQESFGDGMPEMPMLVKDVGFQQNSKYKALCCRLRPGAKALAYYTEPIIESDWDKGYHIYHDHAPPGKRTDWPAVIINKYGKGMCAFLPFPIMQAYGYQPNPWFRQLIRNTFDLMGVPARIQFSGSPAIHLAATQDDEGWLIHLFKILKETNSMFLDDITPSGSVTVTVNPPWSALSVENALTGETITFMKENEGISFTVPGVVDHEIIRILKV